MPAKFIKTGFGDRVIQEDGFSPILMNGKKVGINLDICINYYRGLSVSTVQTLEVKLTGSRFRRIRC